MTGPRYGLRKVTKMIAEVEAHRQAVASGDIEQIQKTWDRIEPHIDYAYRKDLEQNAQQAQAEGDAQ